MLRTDDGSIRGTVKLIEHAKMQNMRNPEQNRRGDGLGSHPCKERFSFISFLLLFSQFFLPAFPLK